MSTRKRAGANRWSIDDENPGSIFHELVVLPTLAPHLARPEYLDSAPRGLTILPQPRSQQIENGITVVQAGAFVLILRVSIALNAIQKGPFLRSVQLLAAVLSLALFLLLRMRV